MVNPDRRAHRHQPLLLGSALALVTLGGFALSCRSPQNPPQKGPPAAARRQPAAALTAAAATAAGPPPSRRQQLREALHGHQVADPYRWLEDASSPETRAWMQAQDAYARAQLAKLPGRAILQRRFEQLSYIDALSAPLRRGQRYFFSRQHADREKAVYYWRQGKTGKPRVLIDPNTLSEDGSVSLRGLSVSYDGRYAAYKLSENAADQATLYVMEVSSGQTSEVDVIPGAKYAHASWTPSGDGFYYTRLPVDPAIPLADLPGHAAVYFHELGQDPRNDRLIHAATGDPQTFISAEISRDGQFLLLSIQHGWTRTDLYYQDLRRGRRPGAFQPLAVGLPALFSAAAWQGKIYLQTNLDAPRYRLLRLTPPRVAQPHWEEIVPERPEAVLEDFALVGGQLALRYLVRAQSELELVTLAGAPLRRISFPELGTVSGLTGNPEDDTAYFAFSSFLRPSVIYRTSVAKGGKAVYSQVRLPVDPSPYTTEQLRYPSADGTEVTLFLLRRKDLRRDGSTPLLLTGYGGFNISLTPSFSAPYFVWLEQGGAVAIPNLRGGGEYGETWHQGGMLTRKQNTFDDFIAAAEHLVRQGYTSPDKLAILGGSNGGLLVGAALTQRPELFRAVACHVPLLDMVRYHLFGSGKTWVSEYGSAEDPAQLAAILAYSPYHRLRPGTPYPALIMMSADSDDRVDPMHARKFTAALQHASSSGLPVLLRIESNAGHGGGDLVKKRVEANVDQFAFLLRQLGVTVRAAP